MAIRKKAAGPKPDASAGSDAGSDAGSGGAATARGWTPLDIALPAFAGVLIAAMLVAAGFMFVKKSDLSAEADLRTCFLEAAESSMENLSNLTPDTYVARYDALIEGSTGVAQRQFEDALPQFEIMMEDSAAHSEGTIVASAIEDSPDNTETSRSVLLVADVVTSNSNQAEPVTESRRARLTVDKIDGQCKTSNAVWVVAA